MNRTGPGSRGFLGSMRLGQVLVEWREGRELENIIAQPKAGAE